MKDYDLFIKETNKKPNTDDYISQTFFHYLYNKYTSLTTVNTDNYFNIEIEENEFVFKTEKMKYICYSNSSFNIIEIIPFFNYEKIIRTAFTPIKAENIFSENYFLENILIKISKNPYLEDLFFLICFIKTILNFENHHYSIIRTLTSTLDAIAFIIKQEGYENSLKDYSLYIQENFNDIEHYYHSWFMSEFNKQIKREEWYITSKKINLNKYKNDKLNNLFKSNYSYILDENKFYNYNENMFI